MKSGHMMGYFVIYRMVPPKSTIKYYYSIDGGEAIYLAEDCPILVLKVNFYI